MIWRAGRRLSVRGCCCAAASVWVASVGIVDVGQLGLGVRDSGMFAWIALSGFRFAGRSADGDVMMDFCSFLGGLVAGPCRTGLVPRVLDVR